MTPSCSWYSATCPTWRIRRRSHVRRPCPGTWACLPVRGPRREVLREALPQAPTTAPGAASITPDDSITSGLAGCPPRSIPYRRERRRGGRSRSGRTSTPWSGPSAKRSVPCPLWRSISLVPNAAPAARSRCERPRVVGTAGEPRGKSGQSGALCRNGPTPSTNRHADHPKRAIRAATPMARSEVASTPPGDPPGLMGAWVPEARRPSGGPPSRR